MGHVVKDRSGSGRRTIRTRRAGLAVGDLRGRRAVVTGGGSGIGRALVLLMAARGATVHVVDRDLERARSVASEIGPSGIAHEVDVTDAVAVAALAAEVMAAGPLDLLFNNAGIALSGDVVDLTLADWERVLSVNLMGVVHGVHAFLPHLLAQGRPAAIVNTSSMLGLMPAAGGVPYAASKGGVLALSQALDHEVAPAGIRVHALCPGVIATDILNAASMRGAFASKQAGLARLYATRGASPDVVARQALDAVARGRTVIPAPRYQVSPPWLLTRLAPQLGSEIWGGIMRLMVDRVGERR